MTVVEALKKESKSAFSFEILPPLRGKSIENVFHNINPLMEFNPKFINITSHREQFNDKHVKVRVRPGTVAIAAALKCRYDVLVVPHILCGGFTKKETEYVLIDLNFIGIDNILCLRGDPLKNEKYYRPEENGNVHAEDLVNQVMRMNKGLYLGDEAPMTSAPTKFSCGVAGYPEKHHTAPSMESDIRYLKQKVDAGADYIITQLFFDNQKYYDFVERCRAEGISVPIIPGIKPIGLKNQANILPELFFCDIPDELKKAVENCKDDEAAKQVGNEWCIAQAKDLIANNVPSVHFYTYGSAGQTYDIAKAIY